MGQQQDLFEEEDEEIETPNEETIDPEVEHEARSMGWTPKEEWRGDPEKWRSAQEFVERGKEILPIVNKRLEHERQRSANLENEIRDMKQTFDEFKEYRSKDQERMYKKALDDLKAQKKVAIEEGNADAVVEIDDAIDELKDSVKTTPVKKEVKQEYDPAKDIPYQEWLAENRWYGNDVELSYYADAEGHLVGRDNPELKGKDFLNEVKRRLKSKFPDKFENPNRQRKTVENAGGGATTGRTKHSYEHLPPDAKASCDKFVKQGLMTREEYVGEYDWE